MQFDRAIFLLLRYDPGTNGVRTRGVAILIHEKKINSMKDLLLY